ncbi:MAG: GNAT family N-acetyltransferase [Mycobacteriaceae bacterium]
MSTPWPTRFGRATRLGPLKVSAGAVSLRPVRLRDAQAWSRVRTKDKLLLQPWEPTADLEWETRHHVTAWPALFSGLRAEARRGVMVPMVIELDGRFAGQLTVGNIVRGALKSAWIGYWVDSDVTGAGVATGAVALGLDYCYARLGLHRVEATVRPENVASRTVLNKVGFREEGLLKRYLDVDGAWRDHLLMAKTIEEVTGSVADGLVRQGKAQWVGIK